MILKKGICIGAICSLAAFAAAPAANAATVTVVDTTTSTDGGARAIADAPPLSVDQDPLGQTFTLTEDMMNIMFGGILDDFNAHLNDTFDMTFQIYEGAGVTGTLLGAVDFTDLGDDFSGLITADFSFLGTLSAGVYTAAFTTLETGGRGGVRQTTSDTGDANSTPYNQDGIINLQGIVGVDLMFFIKGDTLDTAPEVPLPGALPLMASALLGGGFFMRKKKKAAQ